MGSPVTNKKYWGLYEPVKEILEFFEYSGEGEKQAQNLEKNLIKPDIKNPLCLNENCGGVLSSEVLSELAKKRWQEPLFKSMMLSKLRSSAFSKELWEDEAYREKMSKTLSESAKKTWQDEDYREKMSKVRKAKWEDEDYREKITRSRGTPVRVLELATGEVKQFKSIGRARKHYRIGAGTLDKLMKGSLTEYRGLKVLQAPE